MFIMREQVDVICCKSVGTDLSMLDIDDFITEISQLKKEVTSLKTKLMERELYSSCTCFERVKVEIELEKVSCQSSVCVTDGTSTECQDSVWSGRDQSTPQQLLDKLSEQRSRDTQDSQLTLLCSTAAQESVCDSNQGDQTSTESLTSVCNAGEQQMLQTPVKIEVKQEEIKEENKAEEQQSDDEDDDEQQILETPEKMCSVKLLDCRNLMKMRGETMAEKQQRDEDDDETTAKQQQSDEDEDFIPSELIEVKKERQELEKKHDFTTGEKSLSCSETTKIFSLKKSQRTAAENLFTCSLCEKNFTNESQLNIHMKVHTPYMCHQCGKSFRRKESLNYHKMIHTGEKPYKCHLCEKSFKSAPSLTYHLRCHLGVRPFECDKCGKTFVGESCLKRHLQVHTKEKPYKCSVCGKSFTGLYYFKVHQKMHTGVRAHGCFECGKTFITASQLNRHQRIHTEGKPYKCSHCGKTFTRSEDLKIHDRIHTGEKPYKCSYCGKSFSYSQYLKSHERIHTGEKPYHCSSCGRSFTQSAHLQKHVKKYCPSSHSEQKSSSGPARTSKLCT
ncbi:zinc finger protein ZFP2-like isoform X2 [Xyrauchen texanus]|uniref:zinc finger protein ZFP2-like isoform X2 n=1 Tax=Xyrauchen texanus TaxID=154827 RepID=UPI00224233CF|nr:zinc finger protein ZFP2-like isoform X2 [Xyrauchen texanus]